MKKPQQGVCATYTVRLRRPGQEFGARASHAPWPRDQHARAGREEEGGIGREEVSACPSGLVGAARHSGLAGTVQQEAAKITPHKHQAMLAGAWIPMCAQQTPSHANPHQGMRVESCQHQMGHQVLNSRPARVHPTLRGPEVWGPQHHCGQHRYGPNPALYVGGCVHGMSARREQGKHARRERPYKWGAQRFTNTWATRSRPARAHRDRHGRGFPAAPTRPARRRVGQPDHQASHDVAEG